MERNIILAGVGGQGILSIAYVVDNAALDAGLHFKQAEVHGMAQRGGAVTSHLRISDRTIHSDLVPERRADLLLSVEPLEVLRYLHYVAPNGVVIASTTPVINIPDYPPLESVLARLLDLPRLVLVDTEGLAREAGTARAQNMVLLGAAAAYLQLPRDGLRTYVTRLFERKGEKVVNQNLAAFEAGEAVGALFTACIAGGIAHADTLALTQRASGKGIELTAVPAWKDVFAGPHGSSIREQLATLDPRKRVVVDAAAAERAQREGVLA